MIKVIFAGTPEMAVPSLQQLILAPDIQVSAVFTQPDRPSGRGRKLTPSPVKMLALEHNLPVFQPEKLDASMLEKIEALSPDLIIVVAYGLMIPSKILSIPRWGCINAHFSLLPRWRGASPIQQALLHGDEKTGVTIMQLDRGLDTGPILLQEETPIDPEETALQLQTRLAEMGASLLIKTTQSLAQGAIKAVPQNNTEATHAGKIEKADGLIHWQQPAKKIVNQIRAFNPWPVAFTYFKGLRLRIWRAALVNIPVDVPAGVVMDVNREGIEVATGDQVVRLLEVQLPGGKILSAREFLNSNTVLPGDTYFNDEE